MTNSPTLLTPLSVETERDRACAVTPNEREFWLRMRQGMIIQLNALDDMLGLPRAVTPQSHRSRERQTIAETVQKRQSLT